MHAVEGDPEKEFFEQNPELRYYPEIKRLIEKHGEKKAGVYMWAAYMFEDPRSKIYRVPIDERTSIISENYLKPKLKEFSVNELSEIRSVYPRLILTKTQILYKGYTDKIDEANVYIRSLSFDTNEEKVMRMLEKLTKMWPTYEKICEKLEEEEATAQTRKGVVESYREKRAQK